MKKFILGLTILILTSCAEIPKIQGEHLDEEFGETWTILYWAKNQRDAKRLLQRYEKLDIYNEYFESEEDYYIELIDPSDTLEGYDGFILFTDKYKKRLIYVDFIVNESGDVMTNEKGEKVIF